MSNMRWLPLESNPEVMNSYVHKMGLRGDYQFVDVFGLDPELLQMVPKPVTGVVLLFPIAESYREDNISEGERLEKEGQVVSDKVFHMKQTIGNACGTIGLLHCLGNNIDNVTFESGSYLDKFFQDVQGKSRDEIGECLEQSEGISSAHEESAQEGQTEAPELEASLDLHFICFVEKDGHLYELDGNKPFPVNHGPITADTLLEGTANVVKEKFMSKTPDDLRYNLVAFSKQ